MSVIGNPENQLKVQFQPGFLGLGKRVVYLACVHAKIAFGMLDAILAANLKQETEFSTMGSKHYKTLNPLWEPLQDSNNCVSHCPKP